MKRHALARWAADLAGYASALRDMANALEPEDGMPDDATRQMMSSLDSLAADIEYTARMITTYRVSVPSKPRASAASLTLAVERRRREEVA